MENWREIYLHVPQEHRKGLPSDDWFTEGVRPVTYEADGAVNPLSESEVAGTLAPLQKLERHRSHWEKRIYERAERQLESEFQHAAQLAREGLTSKDNVRWIVDAVYLIYDEERMDIFNTIPTVHPNEPFLAFHGAPLCNVRPIIKNNFLCDSPGGRYGNGAYFSTNMVYSQHCIRGFRMESLHDLEYGFHPPKEGHVVYMFGVLLKPGNLLDIAEDATPTGMPYAGKYKNQPKDPDPQVDSHRAFVSPTCPQDPYSIKDFRPVATREEMFAEEIVIFDSRRILPRFIFSLKRWESSET